MAKRFLSTQRIVNLPSDPVSGTEGEFYYNTTDKAYKYYNGTDWTAISAGGGGSGNSFTTINVPNGTDPVADSATDTLNITESNGLIITGTASTDTVEFSTNATALNTASTIVSRDANQSFDITGIDFDTTDTIAAAIGRLCWDDGEGTLSLGLKGGNVNLQLGQENVALCYNGTGSTIPNGSVVYISGAQGQRPSITLSDADTEAASSKTFGITTESIANGAEGFVATFGIVNGVDTSAFSEGAALWLSSTAGQLTETKPTQPAHLVFVGYCLKSHATTGRIFVNPQNGYEIQELHNVSITSVADNHILSYDNATSLWKNQALVDAIKEIDGSGSGIDADLLDGESGSYYLDWTNTTNKPDPVITLGGDLTGSVTLTDLTSQTLTATIAANSVELGTDTTGNYVATIAGTVDQISVTGSGSESAAITLSTPQNIATTSSPTFAGATLDAVQIGITTAGEIDTSAGNLTIDSAGGTVTIDDNLIVSGNLTVNGTTTTIDTTTLLVEDKNIELGVVSSPTDTTANGGGITLKGATDKTFNWIDATDSWTSSEHIDLASGKEYYINGTGVLSSTALGSGIISSSLTSVGTIGTGKWQADIISGQYGGTGVNNSNKTITLGGNLTTSGAFDTTFTVTAATNVTLPTSGTLVNTSVTSLESLVTLATGTGAITVSIGGGATTNATTKTLNIGTAGVSGSTTNINIGSSVSGALGTITMNEQTIFPAATTSSTSIRIPHGTAPSAPTNGDIWTTTLGLFARINGITENYPSSATIDNDELLIISGAW